jgi:hypothetical protein
MTENAPSRSIVVYIDADACPVKAVDERTVKLRALRLAKEAADAEAKAAAPPPAPKRKRS